MAGHGNEYEFLFIAKGGGSANKSFLFQETKALLQPDTLEKFLTEKLKLPKLGQFGVKGNDLESIASKTSNKNNPVKLSHEQLVKILENRI
jgi:alcohol dehydrogenase class IV